MDFIRVAGLHLLHHLIGLKRGEAELQQGILLHADALLRLLLREQIGTEAAAVEQNLGRDDHGTRLIDVAGDLRERGNRLNSGQRFLGHVDGNAPLDACLARIGEHAGCIVDLLDRNPGNLGHLLRRIILHALLQLVEAVNPAIDEVVIEQVLVDDDVEHSKREGGVGSRADGELNCCLVAKPGHARVDADDFHAALHEVHNPVAVEAVGIGDEGVIAPENHHLRRSVIGVIVAIDELLRAVAHPESTRRRVHSGNARKVAGKAGKREAVVRASVRPCKARNPRSDISTRTLKEEDGFSTVAFLQVNKMRLDLIEGLIPRDALPFVLAPVLRVALHGVGESLLAVNHLRKVEAPYAKTALVEGVFLVAFHLNELSVAIGVELDTAPKMTSWPGPRASPRDRKPVFLIPPRFCVLDQIVLTLFGHAITPFLVSTGCPQA